MNTLKTAFFLTVLTLILILVGKLIGGNGGMVFALGLAIIMNFSAYWFSDKIVLKIYKAQQISEADHPKFYNIVRQVAQKSGLPLPKVYIIPTDSPNAFATGRNPEHAAVAATQGILKILNEEELEGVIAHEMAHIRNRDILIGSVVATIAGAISMLAHMAQFAAIFGGFGGRDEENRGGGLGLLLVAIVAPLAAMLVQMAISRSREYQADASGAKTIHNPLGLANALKKLEYAKKRIPLQANPATAHMFIVNPLSARGMANLFSTHPPLEERVARLEQMAKGV
jgi:heat shock protein HtpX